MNISRALKYLESLDKCEDRDYLIHLVKSRFILTKGDDNETYFCTMGAKRLKSLNIFIDHEEEILSVIESKKMKEK